MADNAFERYLSPPDWLRIEESIDPKQLGVHESLFSIGNGYVGSRGIFEESPKGTVPGTYFAGVFDPNAAKVAELVNAPNPFNFKVEANGQKLEIFAMRSECHQRILDLKRGFLSRHTVFTTDDGQRLDYQSLRFISMRDLHVAAMQVQLTPLTSDVNFAIDARVDTSVSNHALMVNPIHFELHELEEFEDCFYTSVMTLATKIEIAYATTTSVSLQNQERRIVYPNFELLVKKGDTLTINHLISFHTTNDFKNTKVLQRKTVACLREAAAKGFDAVFDEHIESMENKWQTADVIVEGDEIVQKGLRFNIYQLLISAHTVDNDNSIGAKGLTGEGYKGHIFWDSVLFLPFFAFTQPHVARRMLDYRFNRMEVAKESAKAQGHAGAMFPWESADTGLEETPLFKLDFDGRLKRIYTGVEEHHITADIFYDIYIYFAITHDEEFMLQKGLFMAIEIARFWASRVTYDEQKDCYEITHVIGPDEFHEGVSNNAYTNALAAWVLLKTIELLKLFRKKYSTKVEDILWEITFDQNELQNWQTIANKIVIHKRKDIIIQFENFLKLKKYPLPDLDEFGLPRFPDEVRIQDLFTTQFVKQPDVILLFYFFPSLFSLESARRNFKFYEKRTLHKSSWSTPIHAGLAAQLALPKCAYDYFHIALCMDIENVDGDTSEGIHFASVGGTWLALIYGFCGIRVLDDYLVIAPQLPECWKSIKLQLNFRGYHLEIEITPNNIIIQATMANNSPTDKAKKLAIKVNKVKKWLVIDKLHKIKYDRKYTHFDYRSDHVPEIFRR